jgi:DNA-binding MurR/RpiR family transcriptional regulator
MGMNKKRLQEFFASRNLTPAERELAEYIMENPAKAGSLSTRGLAERLLVSDMTVLRFVRKLGYANYRNFCREWLPWPEDEDEASGEELPETRRPLKSEFASDLLLRVAWNSMENLKKGLAAIRDEELEEIIEILIESRCRYIAGFQLNSCCADYLARKLQCYLKQVTGFVSEETSQIERMIDIGPEDCVILFSFAPYTRMNEALMRIAKERGARTVLITDKATSPAAAYSDICLTVPVKGAGDVKSYSVPMSVAEAILIRISSQLEDRMPDDEGKSPLLEHYMKWYTCQPPYRQNSSGRRVSSDNV